MDFIIITRHSIILIKQYCMFLEVKFEAPNSNCNLADHISSFSTFVANEEHDSLIRQGTYRYTYSYCIQLVYG